jgi:hypothetical protein
MRASLPSGYPALTFQGNSRLMRIDHAHTLVPMKLDFGSPTITLAVWVLLAICSAGCATVSEPDPTSTLQDIHQRTFSSQVVVPSDPAASPTPTNPATSGQETLVIKEGTWPSIVTPSQIVSCVGTLDSRTSADRDELCSLFASQILEQPPRGNDLPLRPPLRQLWFVHPRLVPLGNDVEFDLPDSEILAHRDHFTSGPFRNPYAGLRDQALLHRDTSRAPVTDSKLPELGPPPPRHTIKTFGTLTGLSLVGIGVYAFAPESFTGTEKDGAWEDAVEHFKEAWTKPPVFDKDPWTVNYPGHSWFGMTYYLSQRNYGESPLYSFLFSTFTSTCFEYFIESWSERPSINDLIVTPVVGSILGELVFRATQHMRKDGFTKAEKILVTIINPLHVLQNGYR